MQVFKKMTALLLILSVLCLLLGCTPDEVETNPTNPPLNPPDIAHTNAAGESGGAAVSNETAGHADTGASVNTGDTTPVTEFYSDEDETISGYTIEIDENYGIGGN